MNKKLKIKINGINTKSLLIALYLSNSKHQIYFNDLAIQNADDYEEKYFTIGNSSKVILEELDLWRKLLPKLYSFDSFSFHFVLATPPVSPRNLKVSPLS